MKILFCVFLASLLFGQLVSFFPLLRFSVYLHDLFLIPLLVVTMVYLYRKRELRLPKLATPIFAFIIVGSLSLLVNISRMNTIQLLTGALYLARWTVYSLVYFFVVQKVASVNFWQIGLFVVGSCFSILGLTQFVFYPDMANLRYLGWDPYYYRLVSTVFDPNFSGIIIALTFFLGLLFRQRYFVILEIINVLALFLTFSRGSYLAFFTGLIVYSYLSHKWKPALLFFLAILIFILIPKPEWEALRITREISAIARFTNWQQSLVLFSRSPIYGHGFNALIPSSQISNLLPQRAGAGIDNSWLFILTTTGLIGFGVWLFLILKILKTAVTLARSAQNKDFGRIFVVILITLAIHSLFTNSLFYPWVIIWTWILVGCAELSISGTQRGG